MVNLVDRVKRVLLTGIALASLQSCDKNYLFSLKESNDLKAFANYTSQFEGKRTHVYDPNPLDGKPEPTIGIGHFMDRGDSRQTFARVLPEVNYDAVYTGRADLTNEQVDRLFEHDIESYVKRAKRLVSNFDNLSLDRKKALVDMAYRGDLGDSPKARALFNSGDFNAGAKAYLDRKEYRTAMQKGMRGIKRRMDSNYRLLTGDSDNN